MHGTIRVGEGHRIVEGVFTLSEVRHFVGELAKADQSARRPVSVTSSASQQ